MAASDFDDWLRSRYEAGPAAAATHRPRVMGVVNVTPDSFSDGGRRLDPDDALRAALEMRSRGADLLDLGAESTRPGSQRTPPDEQCRRLEPVLRRLRDAGFDLPLSIDTTHAAVARLALDFGAAAVNDISAGRDDPELFPLLADRGVPVMLMHMQGEPATMQHRPDYSDVVAEVSDFLAHRADAALRAGILPHRIVLDPGLGFGKTVEHNRLLLKHLPDLVGRFAPMPVLVGASRKGFLSRLADHPDTATPADREAATTAVTAWSVANGAALLRVHEVAAARDAVRVAWALTR